MKIIFTKHNQDGAVLMTTVCILVVLTLMIGSYLFMLKNESYSVSRDQSWNRALVLAEAGIEEAMAHINRGGLAKAPQSFGGDTWQTSGTNYYLPNGPRTDLDGGSYSLILTGPANLAIITSKGTVTAPLSNTDISRTIQVVAPFTSGFQVGIASITTVTLSGGGKLTIDSYDSTKTNLFPGGLYNITNRQAHGDIAVVTNSAGVFNLGNASIMGVVHTGAGGQQKDVKIGPQGAVGSVGYVTGTGVGFESTAYFADDFNLTFPDVNLPDTTGWGSVTPPSSGNKTTNTLTLTSGSYSYTGNFDLPNNTELVVDSYQYVTLYVSGNFSMNNGGAAITIKPGGTLILYVGGSSASFSKINSAGNSNNFQYYGLPGNTGITLSGNDSYLGTMYAPEADVTFSGGGKSAADYQGAMVVRSLSSNGHFNMHYDENLAKTPIIGTFVPTNWVELGAN